MLPSAGDRSPEVSAASSTGPPRPTQLYLYSTMANPSALRGDILKGVSGATQNHVATNGADDGGGNKHSNTVDIMDGFSQRLRATERNNSSTPERRGVFTPATPLPSSMELCRTHMGVLTIEHYRSPQPQTPGHVCCFSLYLSKRDTEWN